MKNLKRFARYAKLAARAFAGLDPIFSNQLKCPRLKLGNDHADWSLCPIGVSDQSIVYSFGVGEDISFDLELIARFGSTVHAFDPTPRSVEWIRRQTLPKEFIFHPYGVADCDGTTTFTPPSDPKYVSYRLLKQTARKENEIELPVYRLSTIMESLGHKKIDLLKMDIEGAEYDVLADLIANNIEASQILVEFHHRWPEIGRKRTTAAVRHLNSCGYKIFYMSPSGEEYSFRKVL